MADTSTRTASTPENGADGATRTVQFADPILQAGFTQIPNGVLRNASLSMQARLTFALLASYAWQKGSCFPGQERLAADLGASERSLRTYLTELQAAGLLEVQRRGRGRRNVYVLMPISVADSPLQAAPGSDRQESTPNSAPDRPSGANPTPEHRQETPVQGGLDRNQAAGEHRQQAAGSVEEDPEYEHPELVKGDADEGQVGAADEVAAFYLAEMQLTRPDPTAGERKLILEALDVATADEIKKAIAACARDEWYCKRGEHANRPGPKRNRLTDILRPRRGEPMRDKIASWLGGESNKNSPAWRKFLGEDDPEDADPVEAADLPEGAAR